MFRMSAAIVVAIAISVGSSSAGCDNGLLNTKPMADYKKDEKGDVTLLDTERNWNDWREVVDAQIESEVAGAQPPGFSSWHEKWLQQLESIERVQENSDKYVRYIVETRKKAGLSDLEGYSDP